MACLSERFVTQVDSRLLLRECTIEWQQLSDLDAALANTNDTSTNLMR